MVCRRSWITWLLAVLSLQYTDSSPVGVEGLDRPQPDVTDGPLRPPCCKVFHPPPPYRKIPRPNRFREGRYKDGNDTYQVGDTWNHEPECVERECTEDGAVVVNRCPPVPENVSEGWELRADSGGPGYGSVNFFPFCCKKLVPKLKVGEEGCYVDNSTVNTGVQVDIPGKCYHHVCTGNNQWSNAECGNLGAWHAWEVLPGDTSKPYPDCCGKTVPVLDIVPDVLLDLPSANYLGIVYGNTSVDYGNVLTPEQVRDPPLLANPPSFGVTELRWNLLLMVDPDMSSGKMEFLHWMVGNFHGNNITSGEVIAQYMGAVPLKGSGLHRYISFLYEQPERLRFEEVRLNSTSVAWRKKFSTRRFAEKYKLGDPVGFNVFRALWDETVPELLKKFGIKDRETNAGETIVTE